MWHADRFWRSWTSEERVWLQKFCLEKFNGQWTEQNRLIFVSFFHWNNLNPETVVNQDICGPGK